MSLPLHHAGSVPVPLSAAQLHERLRSDAAELVEAATAEALTGLAPLLAAWGSAPSRLPSVHAEPSGEDAPGSVALRWRGEEDQTCWPSLDGWLAVRPDGPDRSRLALLTTRAPELGLRAQRLDPLHRQRVVTAAVRAALQAVARHAQHDAPPAAAEPRLEVAR